MQHLTPSTLASYSIVSVRALPSGSLLYFGLRLISLIDLSDRVSFDQKLSEDFQLDCGVPQGSCLGPLLFMIYASKLFEVIKEYLPQAHAYPDDSQLYLSFKADSTSSQIDPVNFMERCVDAIRCWMIKDKLSLNDYQNNTKFIIIGTRQQLAKVNIASLCVGDANIALVTVKNLGSWFDESMTMVTHINKLCKAASFHL